MTLTSLANSVVLTRGWRRILIAFSAGAVSTLALPPLGLWPVPFLTFPLMVWLVDGAAGRLNGVLSAAMTGWWFGFGYFVAGLYWLGHAFLVDAETFAWLLPLAVVGLPAVLAIFTALGLALARLCWTQGATRVLALAAALTIVEWLRGTLFTGFPWNTYGYALVSPLWLAQGAALVGLWGLTFLAVAAYASPAVLADRAADTRRPWLAPALSAAILAALALYGALRLSSTPTRFVDGVKLRIMQPNLKEDVRFNYDMKQQVVSGYLALSDRNAGPDGAGVRSATHLIWPEAAFPFFLTRETDVLRQIADFLPEGTVLITGAIRAPDGVPAADLENTPSYNSVYVIDHDGSILSVYDKVHLVPFGEYLPFQNLLERIGLMQLTKVVGGYIPGDRLHIRSAPRAPDFQPLICYEVVFPGKVVSPGERPGWLLNVTNDGWFGTSAGPYQHFQQARLRAIEEGLPLVRAANTGISAVVDPLGRVIRSLPLGAEGVLDSPLPQPLAPTLYARVRDIPAGLVVVGALVLVIARRRRSAAFA